MPRAAVHAQLREALRVVVHVARDGTGRDASTGWASSCPTRRMPATVRVDVAFTAHPDRVEPGPGWSRLLELSPSVRAAVGRVDGRAEAAGRGR